MKPTRHQQEEARRVHDLYWESYLTGDEETLASLLDEQYTQIGSVEEEVFFSKKEAVQFVVDTIDQIAGKVEMRNRVTKSGTFQEFILISEQCDLFVWSEGEWTFYSKFRASTLLQKKENEWKIIHQHSSLPDSRTQEGENIAIEKITAENLQLREAVKRRTVELEIKNRELQIEAAMERVRARSSKMQNANELGEVISVIFNKLDELQISVKDGVALITFSEGSKDLNEWMANPGFGAAMNFHLSYFDHPVLSNLWKAKNRGEEILIQRYSAEENKSFLTHIFEHSDFKNTPQNVKDYCLAANTYATTIAFQKHTAIFINDYSDVSLTSLEIDLLKRFSLVFEQTYVRFLDLQKAEAQAREAQIEAALERVRSRTMGMQRSDELQDAALLLFQQIQDLGIPPFACGFNIWDDDMDAATAWMGSVKGLQPPFKTDSSKDVYLPIYKAAQKGEPLFVIEQSGKDLEEHYEYLATIPTFRDIILPEFKKAGITLPTFQIIHCAFFSQGYLMFISYESCPGAHDIFVRFAKVFEQTYTRFLDLQKAEKQAREAQIEAALERVRSRSMAMHTTSELQEVIHTVHKELLHLDLPIAGGSFIAINSDITSEIHCWGSGGTADTSEEVHIPRIEKPLYTNLISGIKTGFGFFTEAYTQQEKKEFFTQLFKHQPWSKLEAKQKKEILSSPGGYARSCCVSQHTSIFIINHFGVKFSEADNDILSRFGKVFEQTYTRFLDLQKAEAQTREAQIEAALERVRARAMAMHRSDELAETSAVLFEQMKELGIQARRVGFALIKDEDRLMEIYSTVRQENGSALLLSGILNEDQHPQLTNIIAAWRKNEATYYSELHGAELQAYYRSLQETLNFAGHMKSEFEKATSEYFHLYNFGPGMIYALTSAQFNDEENRILKRFTQAFDLVYRRFQDLQKAEAQTRQAKIEAAMEKVRARAMAMQKPDELVEVAQLLRKEMGLLGVEELETSSIYILQDETGKTECWYAIQDQEEKKLVADHMLIDLNDTWVGREMLKFYRSDQKRISILMQGEPRKEWINYCAERSNVFSSSGFYGETIPDRIYHLYKFSNGYIGAASSGSISAESWELLKRATAVFSLAYTRFNDLQQAEANAKEAVKQASLDRIRADIASMRRVEDLDRITPLIWNELTVLGIPFIRCGVFIIDESLQLVEAHLSAPDGHSLGILRLPFDANDVTRKTVDHWKRKEVYQEHWDKEEFTQWTQSMLDKGQIQDVESFQGDVRPLESLYLHFIPFLQGMLYVGNANPLSHEQVDMVKAMANAFSTAYARYEDFTRLEKAKHSVETTLSELKAAQAQLVQTEKMASLGELTAGIAHEIQNPLNFVNNFSEVNSELIEELEEEAKKGNLEEVTALAKDIRDNEHKIAHHGKRADAIVKGMLQHSRTSTGAKEPTDINVLADEYLRLAYHGLRARDKNFNAEFSTDFDESLPKIEVIPQDIGRVLLNLINNAFYAVAHKKQTSGNDYSPKVAVSTKLNPPIGHLRSKASAAERGAKGGDLIEIRVSDNGPGIPDHIKEKIFQPFFTTKPTGQGTGLGLSLAYDIVKTHGGELKVETKEDEGSIFIIQLPMY